ncbi:MAG: hypothetical protein ACOYO1_03055 [Bacteroidales bacterium]
MNNNFRIVKRNIQITILAISFVFFHSCTKDETENTILPDLILKTGGIYSSKDTAIAEGSQICIGIHATANGGENLCNLIIHSNNDQVLLDYGFNATQIDKDVIIHKNADSIQIISIIIRNKNGGSDSISISLRKNGSAYKTVFSYNFILGGQNNSSIGSFASLSNGMIYSLTDASQNQSLIDILYYYSLANQEYNCLSSSGGNVAGIFSGVYAPENWSLKNTTYFSRSIINIPISCFDEAQNDSIIIANIFSNGGRKAKALVNNQIWGLQTQNGKYGLLKIIEVNGMENGNIKFAVKVQQ